ncbi:MAG: glycosyltransferase family 4 protein [Chromatiales bacterium]|nr:glycosyltransferase family 4 protein [Gammaproteobacteria bacterium]
MTIKISLVAHNAYGAISGGSAGHVGGVERQTSMMAFWLQKKGFDVSIITWDEGQEQDFVIDGVRLIKLCRKDEGLPGMRFFHPRWSSLNAALKRADADVYYQNGAEYVTGQVALWCKRNRKKFIFSSASDADCQRNLPCLDSFREKYLYKKGLELADHLIVQTEKQAVALLDAFGMTSTVLPMPCPDLLSDEQPAPKDFHERKGVIWVGRISEEKRLEFLLEVAAKTPEITYDVLGKPNRDSEYARSVLDAAEQAENVNIRGMVERDRIRDFYANARILCCTSSFEGFPNTFIEAWSEGLPIVTTFDPDDLVQRKQLGFAGSEISDLAEKAAHLHSNEDEWTRMSRNARQYFVENHELDAAMERFSALFRDV